jgi:DUF4097 and DUF4098 domain-containing protein YvlB
MKPFPPHGHLQLSCNDFQQIARSVMTMKKTGLRLAITGLLACLIMSVAWAQDPPRNYPAAQGTTISIANVSGDISVTGANVTTVVVTTIREGRDKDAVQIEDLSSGGNISLKARYPREGNIQANVQFVVQVPVGYRLKYDSLSTASGDINLTKVAGAIDAKTASGDISITQVEGTVRASTASGDIKVQGAAGMVTANTASGDIEVELARIDATPEANELKFASASGDVTVRALAPLNAQVELSTASGSISNDFGLRVEELEGHGKKVSGILGSGAIKLKMSTASGDLKLIK